MPEPESSRQQVIQRELLWHEQESHRRYRLDSLLYDSPAFDEVVQHSIAFLRGEPGDLVLDMGCGEGKETLELARRGLHVIGADLSFTQLQRARELIGTEMPAARFDLIQANAEQLPFKRDSFRMIYGKAVLHHLDLESSARETQRLLGSGGRAAFAEPLARHFIIWLGRRLTPRLRTEDEAPLELSDLEQFSRAFRREQLQFYYLLTPIVYPLRLLPGGEGLFSILYAALSRLDQKLLSRFKSWRKFAWYGAVRVQVESGED
jgi:ubiquinone/menaquinone biosynthesis C-methylase UbiE